MRKRNGVWWIDTTRDGRPIRRSLRTGDRREAARREREILDAIDRDALGLRARASRSPLVEELVIEFEAELRRKGRSEEHIVDTLRSVARLAAFADVLRVGDWTPAALERGLGCFADRSARTRNKMRGHVNTFFRWAIRTGRTTSRNPVDAVEALPSQPKRRERRALTTDELAELLRTAPEPRSLIYRVAATTGLRRAELNRLRASDVDFERGVITLRAEATKARRADTLPLPQSTVRAWLQWLEDPWIKLRSTRQPCPGRLLPPVPHISVFGEDRDRAGIVPGDRRVDFHALRVTYITNLCRAGVPFDRAVKLARHCDPKLTAKVYLRFDPHDLRKAVDQLEQFLEGDSSGSDAGREAG